MMHISIIGKSSCSPTLVALPEGKVGLKTSSRNRRALSPPPPKCPFFYSPACMYCFGTNINLSTILTESPWDTCYKDV